MDSIKNRFYLAASSNQAFWGGVVLLVFLKLLLLSGAAIQMVYSPHDDGLYVSRAFHLLMDGSLGPYDARLLVKQPGISLWLAGSRLLGIPYLLSINLFFVVAGTYFIASLKSLELNKLMLFIVFGLYLFNPVSIDSQWFRVMREPVAISFLVTILASMIFILANIYDKKIAVIHFFILNLSFAFALMVREEDRLLYALVMPFIIFVFYKYWPIFAKQIWLIRFCVLLILFSPFIMALIGSGLMRSYVDHHYGMPLLHDFGEGEFPRLISAIRSVDSRKDNRHVMITQESLGKIRQVVPDFAPVIDRLPAPSQTSYSCDRFKVCSEWTNGWMLFWVKDAAFQAGLTPTLPAGQAYFKNIAKQIEKACEDGKLKCTKKGQGLLPTFELRWTRAFLQELSGVFQMMTQPRIGAVGVPPETYPVDIDYGRMYQLVTMSHYYDSQRQSFNLNEAWKNQPQDIYLSLKYWMRYPDIATNEIFGVKAGAGQLGAKIHYDRHGQHEGRVWQEDLAKAYEYITPIDSAKNKLVSFYEKIGWVLEIVGLVALLIRLLLWSKEPLSPFIWVVVFFMVFTVLRLLAMSYISVYMGSLDVRLFFSTYVILILMAPLVIADLCKILILHRGFLR